MNILKTIIHPVLRAWIRSTTWLFFEKVIVKGVENIPATGPVILASNHPNSFLDGLVITSLYKRPIYYLARGDVFVSSFVSSLLGFLNIVPIFRKQEGPENFHKNAETFTFCLEAFKKNGTIIIFSEGTSENEWHLRPLRKGTARLTYDAWNDQSRGEKLKVVPVAIHYSSWLQIKCRVYIDFMPPIEKSDFANITEQGPFLKNFTEKLQNSLKEKCAIVDKEKALELQNITTSFLLKNIEEGNKAAIKLLKSLNNGGHAVIERFSNLATYLKKEKIEYHFTSNLFYFILSLPLYAIGLVLNVIPYSICKTIARKTTHFNEFFDSVIYCTLLFFYPIYLLAILLFARLLFHSGLLGLGIVLLTIITAKTYEWAKRNIFSFLKKGHQGVISTMLRELFEISNG